MWRQTTSIASLLVLWLPVSGRASAQSEAAVPGPVKVTLRSEKPQTRLAVLPAYPPEDSEVDPSIKVCDGDCSLSLPPGNYRVEVSSTTDEDIRAGTMMFTIDGDAKVSVTPASRKRRRAGIGIAITGMTIAGAATAMTLLGLFINSASECTQSCQNDTQENRDRHALKIVEVGGAVALLGAAIATVGWTLFAHNRSPRVKVESGARKPSAVDNLHLVPVRMHAGWGLGGEMRF